ncbi:DEAD/DEAH box helicase [Isoptericola croceus]|uniref:DEAD/DEAH box helicase n=1 Tax=Isoptericola croceus TaxID=3031406 RepID=UPI0023F618F8|nr:DEAD/DEAH box helicase [Isoptericola croceus]
MATAHDDWDMADAPQPAPPPPASAPSATLGRTWVAPAVALRFAPSARHARTGERLLDWVRALPGRRWDSARSRWVVTGIGPHPHRRLVEAGFTVDLTSKVRDPDLAAIDSLDDVAAPYAELDGLEVRIHPRLGGYDAGAKVVPAGAVWDRGTWRATAIDVVAAADARQGRLVLADGVREVAESAAHRTTTPEQVADQTAHLAASIGTNTDPDALAEVVAEVGDVPGWFGLDLYPYQRAGAIALAAGHSLDCDEPGAGKTRTTLAAAAVAGARRVLVLCPSKVITSWARESATSGVPTAGGTRDGHVVTVVPGRRQPDLPEAGVAVMTDSILTSRDALRAQVTAWAPDVLIYDEIHRAKSWTSARAQVIRELAATIRLCIGATGTPMHASPAEMTNQLAITGHLDPVFGGRTQFLKTYCRKNHWGAWVPRKNALADLNRQLDAHVWVRRLKADILPDLPTKSRRAQVVDVDLAGFRAAHAEVTATVADWVSSLDHELDLDDDADLALVESWAREQIGLMSPLRVAAGMAKVPAAAEQLTEWVAATVTHDADGPVCDRPLVVWCHHRDVAAAMLDAARKAVGEQHVGHILGSTSPRDVERFVDAFQAGRLPVLVCSIGAAGVGLTLTASSDALFVETSYVVAEIAQAEDRISRIGQARPVLCTTMVAPGTLDERIQHILATKGGVLDQVLVGGDNHVAVWREGEHTDALAEPSQIIAGIVAEIVASRRSRRRRRAA